MKLPVSVRRLGYRSAHAGLRVYWLVRRPEVSGVKCVLTDGERVLLVRHTYGERDWDLPGGAIKRGEPPATCARREMSEELGISIDDWVALGEMRANIQHRRDTIHCFQARLSAPQLTIDRGELAAIHWFKRDHLPGDLNEHVRPILDRAPAG